MCAIKSHCNLSTVLDSHVDKASKLQDVIGKCWAQDPAERPAAADLIRTLATLQPVVDAMDAQCPIPVIDIRSKQTSTESCCVVC